MAKRSMGTGTLEGIREVQAYKTGRRQLETRRLKDPAPTKEIRKRPQLSQSASASLMGVSQRTVQDWEQGRRAPSGPARSLLRVAEHHPEVFVKIE